MSTFLRKAERRLQLLTVQQVPLKRVETKPVGGQRERDRERQTKVGTHDVHATWGGGGHPLQTYGGSGVPEGRPWACIDLSTRE